MRFVLVGLVVFATAVSAVTSAGCAKPASPAPASGTAAAASPAGDGRGGGGRGGAGGAAPVSVAQVIEKSMPVILRAVGTVVASSTVDIRSQVTGLVLKVGFTEGQDVTSGQVLFTLDPRPFQITLNQANSVLAKDKAQAANVEESLRRAEELFARGLLPRADRDTIAANAAALRGTVAADGYAIENAQLQLQFTKITAPVSGRTGALIAHQGALVRANDAAPLVTINQTSPIHVSFAVPARLLPQVRPTPGKSALTMEASIPGANGATTTGTLGFIDSSVDATTDTIKVKGNFPNTDHQLWPGQYVDVTLLLSVDPNAIVIPTSAVQSSQQGQFAYVVKADKTVESRPIKVARTEGEISVIESGLTVEDQVVTDGQLRLTPGAKVSIKPQINVKSAPDAGRE